MYDNFLQMKYGKEINFHIDFYKGVSHKNKHVRRTQAVNCSRTVSLNLLFVSKKKKVLNQAFDKNKPVDFFYCQFSY